MTKYARTEAGYFKWSKLPKSQRSKISNEQIEEILHKLMQKPGETAIVNSAVAYHLKERGCKIFKRSEMILENGQPQKVIQVYACWIPAT